MSLAPPDPGTLVAAEAPASGHRLTNVKKQWPVLVIDNVSKMFGHGDIAVHALREVSLVVERGDFVAIMGASGSGKSTLMNVIGCLDVPTTGRYLLDGIDVRQLDDYQQSEIRNRKIGFVFQAFNLIPRTTALANVELPLIYAKVHKSERRRRALAALDLVGLSNRIDHTPSQLSGGQQQRVAIARAIATDPSLILADEPTGALDSTSTQEVMGILGRLHRDGRTVVIITHEDDVAAHASRVIRLRDGRIVSDMRTDVTPVVLRHALHEEDAVDRPVAGPIADELPAYEQPAIAR